MLKPHLRLGAAVLAAFVLASGPASAALIALNDPTLPASADGFNITRDTVTGLEWLDLDVSVGRTYDDLNGGDGVNDFLPGGDFEGFRHATILEVTGANNGPQFDSLFKSAGVGAAPFSSIGTYSVVHELIGLVGCFANCPTYGYADGFLEDQLTGLESELYIENFASSGFNWGRFQERVAIIPALTNQGFPIEQGNWLVRSIPEPGTAALVGLGLVGACIWRSRQDD